MAVVSAGTSDLPVAEEAAVVLEHLGHPVDRIVDVGVAGIHRLFSQLERLRAARAIVVAAGMEGALPSVVAGLVDRPVVAVPTSIGYGASFGGVAALLGMLNSCAAGIGVVNIDNGFGAATLVHRIALAIDDAEAMMSRRVLYLDCAGGAAGDMVLCALTEAADCAALIEALPAKLGFADVTIDWPAGRSGGFAARRLRVGFDSDAHPQHRNLADVESHHR